MKKLFLILSLIFIYEISLAQWQQLKGPSDGQINCLLNNNGVLYVGTAAGVYVSEDKGNTWIQRNNGLLKDSVLEWTSSIQSFGAMGNRVFAGTEGGLMMTTDKGNNWKLMLDSLTYYTGVPVITVSGSILLEGTESNGIFMSLDSGITWRNTFDSLPNTTIQYIFTYGNKIMAKYYNYNKYFTSSDTGKTWVDDHSFLANENVSSINFNNGLLYAGTDLGIYVSVDTGKTWRFSVGLQHDFGNSVFNGNYIYSFDGVYTRPNDSSITWTWLYNMPLPQLNGFLNISLAGDTVFAGTGYGLFWSNDYALTWHNDNALLYNAPVNALAVNDHGIVAANDSGTHFSADDGNTWTIVNHKDYATNNFIKMVTNGNDIFMIGYDSLRVSEDNGVTWKVVPTVTGTDLYMATFAANGSNIFLSGNIDSSSYVFPRTYWSADKGATWLQVFKNLPKFQSSNNSIINSFSFTGDTVYITCNSYLFYSINNGISWVQLDSGSNDNFYLLAINGNNFISIGGYSQFNVSHDKGLTWQQSLNTTYINRGDIFTLFAVNDTFYAGDADGGTYFSPDSGMNWYASNPINFGGPSYAVHNGSIYAGGEFGTGVWKHYSSASVINSIPEIKKGKSFVLYPNPAENGITIVTANNNNSKREISVYNLLGKLMVRQTVNTSSAAIDIHLFPPGVYFAHITDENGAGETMKFVKQ